MSAQELITASSSATVRECVAEVDSILQTLGGRHNVHADAYCVIKAFEMLQISTHNLHKIDIASGYERRKLFKAANSSLQSLVACISTRLNLPLPTSGQIENMEQTPTFLYPDLTLSNLYVEQTVKKLSQQYNDIIQNPDFYDAELAGVQSLMRAVLGDLMDDSNELDIKQSPLVKFAKEFLSEGEFLRFNGRRYGIAFRLVVFMAIAISLRFKNQAVHVMGTAIPASVFA